jgi:hypothetical protein
MKKHQHKVVIFYKRKSDGHVYSVECDKEDIEVSHKNVSSELWDVWKIIDVAKVTDFQFKILTLMVSQESYDLPLWGFSAMGYREISRLLNIKAISVSNAMRQLVDKKVFFNATAKDQWDDTTYFLANPYISKERGGVFEKI